MMLWYETSRAYIVQVLLLFDLCYDEHYNGDSQAFGFQNPLANQPMVESRTQHSSLTIYICMFFFPRS